MSRESDEVGEDQFWDQFRYDPDYEPLPTSTHNGTILVVNEPISLGKSPF